MNKLLGFLWLLVGVATSFFCTYIVKFCSEEWWSIVAFVWLFFLCILSLRLGVGYLAE
jgi:hypothetical protein